MIDTQELEERLFRHRHRQSFKPEPKPTKPEKLRHYMIGDWRTSAANKRAARKLLHDSLKTAGIKFPKGVDVIEVHCVNGEWVPKQR
jgi:hypothetical protein